MITEARRAGLPFDETPNISSSKQLGPSVIHTSTPNLFCTEELSTARRDGPRRRGRAPEERRARLLSSRAKRRRSRPRATVGEQIPLALDADRALSGGSWAEQSDKAQLTSRARYSESLLASRIDSILSAKTFEGTTWGACVRSTDSGRPLYQMNAESLLRPASTQKLVTLAVSADRLGWNHTFKTGLFTNGHVEFAKLDGDLLVVGSGDPSFGFGDDPNVFRAWAEQLRADGILEIGGDLVGDDSVFDEVTHAPDWSLDDAIHGYAAAVSGLCYEKNCTTVTVMPGPAVGRPALCSHGHKGSGVLFEPRVITAAKGTETSIQVRQLPGRRHFDVLGSIAIGSEPVTKPVPVLDPAEFFLTSLRNHLTIAGIDVCGRTLRAQQMPGYRSKHNWRRIAMHESPPLSTLAVHLMTHSDNLYAEALHKTIGAGVGDPSFKGGSRAVASTLRDWGLRPFGMDQRDGSGLSPTNLVSADVLVSVLHYVARHESLRGPFEAALPCPGQAGTLTDRMRNAPTAWTRVRAKTGSLTHARSLAGYAKSLDGETFAFAVIANGYSVDPDRVNRAIDAVVGTVAEFKR